MAIFLQIEKQCDHHYYLQMKWESKYLLDDNHYVANLSDLVDKLNVQHIAAALCRCYLTIHLKPVNHAPKHL